MPPITSPGAARPWPAPDDRSAGSHAFPVAGPAAPAPSRPKPGLVNTRARADSLSAAAQRQMHDLLPPPPLSLLAQRAATASPPFALRAHRAAVASPSPPGSASTSATGSPHSTRSTRSTPRGTHVPATPLAPLAPGRPKLQALTDVAMGGDGRSTPTDTETRNVYGNVSPAYGSLSSPSHSHANVNANAFFSQSHTAYTPSSHPTPSGSSSSSSHSAESLPGGFPGSFPGVQADPSGSVSTVTPAPLSTAFSGVAPAPPSASLSAGTKSAAGANAVTEPAPSYAAVAAKAASAAMAAKVAQASETTPHTATAGHEAFFPAGFGRPASIDASGFEAGPWDTGDDVDSAGRAPHPLQNASSQSQPNIFETNASSQSRPTISETNAYSRSHPNISEMHGASWDQRHAAVDTAHGSPSWAQQGQAFSRPVAPRMYPSRSDSDRSYSDRSNGRSDSDASQTIQSVSELGHAARSSPNQSRIYTSRVTPFDYRSRSNSDNVLSAAPSRDTGFTGMADDLDTSAEIDLSDIDNALNTSTPHAHSPQTSSPRKPQTSNDLTESDISYLQNSASYAELHGYSSNLNDDTALNSAYAAEQRPSDISYLKGSASASSLVIHLPTEAAAPEEVLTPRPSHEQLTRASNAALLPYLRSLREAPLARDPGHRPGTSSSDADLIALASGSVPASPSAVRTVKKGHQTGGGSGGGSMHPIGLKGAPPPPTKTEGAGTKPPPSPLEVVDLSHRDVSEIPTEVIEELRGHIDKLALGHNALTDLPASFAMLGTTLKYLNIRLNSFSSFPVVLSNMPSLEILDISRNKIRAFPAVPGSLTRLKILSVSKNRIKRLPDYIGEMTNLRILKIDNNPIEWPPREITAYSPPPPPKAPSSSDERRIYAKLEEAEMLRWLARLMQFMRGTPDLPVATDSALRAVEVRKEEGRSEIRGETWGEADTTEHAEDTPPAPANSKEVEHDESAEKGTKEKEDTETHAADAETLSTPYQPDGSLPFDGESRSPSARIDGDSRNAGDAQSRNGGDVPKTPKTPKTPQTPEEHTALNADADADTDVDTDAVHSNDALHLPNPRADIQAHRKSASQPLGQKSPRQEAPGTWRHSRNKSNASSSSSASFSLARPIPTAASGDSLFQRFKNAGKPAESLPATLKRQLKFKKSLPDLRQSHAQILSERGHAPAPTPVRSDSSHTMGTDTSHSSADSMEVTSPATSTTSVSGLPKSFAMTSEVSSEAERGDTARGERPKRGKRREPRRGDTGEGPRGDSRDVSRKRFLAMTLPPRHYQLPATAAVASPTTEAVAPLPRTSSSRASSFLPARFGQKQATGAPVPVPALPHAASGAYTGGGGGNRGHTGGAGYTGSTGYTTAAATTRGTQTPLTPSYPSYPTPTPTPPAYTRQHVTQPVTNTTGRRSLLLTPDGNGLDALSAPAPAPAPPSAEMDRNSGAYFRRLSMLPASSISPSVPAPLLAVTDTMRGILFSFSQMYTALRQFIAYASRETLPAAITRLMASADGSMQHLINALDRFDSFCRRGAPPAHIVRDILVHCRLCVALFRRLVTALRARDMQRVYTTADPRYARTFTAMLYASLGELAASWRAMAPVLATFTDGHGPRAGAPSLLAFLSDPAAGSPHTLGLGAPPVTPLTSPPDSAFTSHSSFADHASNADHPSLVSLTSPPLMSPPISSLTSPQAMYLDLPIQRNASGAGLFRERSRTRRHAGSFSVEDVELGAVLPPASGPSSYVPTNLKTFVQPDARSQSDANLTIKSSARPHAPPTPSYPQPAPPPPPLPPRSASTEAADAQLITMGLSTSNIALNVYEMLLDSLENGDRERTADNEIVVDSGGTRVYDMTKLGPDLVSELQELCVNGKTTTSHLQRAIESVQKTLYDPNAGITPQQCKYLGECAYMFVQSVIKFAKLVKTITSQHGFAPRIRDSVGHLTLSTREFAHHLSHSPNSFKPTYQRT